MAREHRMKIGGTLTAERLAMVSILGAKNTPGIAGIVLDALGAQGINVEFISSCPDLGEGATISFCVEEPILLDALAQIERIRTEIGAQQVMTNKSLCLVAVFGPHFREIPNVASQVFKTLAEAGINILAISTSVSSVTCVFEEAHLQHAIQNLRTHFEIP
jgi:aspartokinase